MKKSSEVLLVAVALAASFIVPSLEAGEAAAKRAARRGAIAAELGLTDEQKSSLQALRQQERESLQALKADTALSAEEKRAKVQEIRQGFRGQAQGVFTPDQQARLKEHRASHPGSRPVGQRHRKG